MLKGYRSALRYSRAWSGTPAALEEEEVPLGVGDREVPATLYLPVRRGPRPAVWVVLHGLTPPGREHPALVRFCRALASTGTAVLCPEIPEWRRLALSPETALPVIKQTVLALPQLPQMDATRTGLIGFSFGAPQALAAAADPEIGSRLRCVAGFGGFFDLERTLHFLFTGHHEWQGRDLYRRPDPYGRWIVGANHLTDLPEWAHATDVAEALRKLAMAAGEHRIDSWDPCYDPLKAKLRAGVARERRELFDLFAPVGGGDPAGVEIEPLVQGLAATIRGRSPTMEPQSFVRHLKTPVRLLHGRADHLIPYTETLRATEAMRGHTDVRSTITGLFGHSGAGEAAGGRVQEGVLLFRALADLLGRI